MEDCVLRRKEWAAIKRRAADEAWQVAACVVMDSASAQR